MTQWSYDAEQCAGRLVIDGELTVGQVGRLRESLLQALAAAEQVVIDLAAVTEADIAGLQLLFAAHRQAAADGRMLLLSGGSAQLQALARGAGFMRAISSADDRNAICF